MESPQVMDVGPSDFATHVVPLDEYAAHLALLAAGKLLALPRLCSDTPYTAGDRTHDARGRYCVDGYQEFVNPWQPA